MDARVEPVAEQVPGTRPAEPDAARASRPRLRRAAPLLPWVAVPALVLLAYAALPPVTQLRSQYQASAAVLVTAPALAWLLTRRGRLARHTAAALTAAVLPGLTLIALQGTDWFFAGPSGDNSFRMEYAARFADDLGSLSDYTYRDVPAFYSPGWFWLVGLIVRLTDVPAWQAYKWVAIASLYAAGALAFWLWRRSFDLRTSALLLATTVIGLPSAAGAWLGTETLLAGAYEPYAWPVILALPALLTWFARSDGGFSWRRGLLLGVALAAAAWAYLLYAAVAAVAVLVLVLRRGAGRARRLEVLLAAGTSVVLVLPWLGPFVLRFLEAGTPPASATSYVNEGSYVRLLEPFASPWFVLAAVGGVALLGLHGERFARLRGCQAVLVTVLLLGVLQLIAGQAGSGVLFHRLLLILGVTLLAGGTLTLVEHGPSLVAWVSARSPSIPWRRLAAAVLTVLLFLGLSGHAQEWMDMNGVLRQRAHDIPYPDGTLPALASPEARQNAAAQPSVDELAGAAARVARSAGRSDTGVVLTDDVALLATTPTFGYLQWWELYSNPLGEYRVRQQFLQDLAAQQPDRIAPLLRADPDAPTVFVLRTDGDAVTFGSTTWDPAGPRSQRWSVRLPISALSSPEFVSTRVGDWLVAALRTR